MARQRPEDVIKEVNQQEDDNYGDETISGTNPRPDSDDDLEKVMDDVVGSDFDEEKPLDIADEIEDDEEEIQKGEINDYQSEEDPENEEPEGELERIEKKEDVSTDDPMDDLSDDDFGDEDPQEEEE